MSEYVTEDSFVIAEGTGNNLYIFLEAKTDVPSSPRIIYDGKDHAIFLRNNDQKIILDYINPEIRDKLRKSREVMVVETLLENIQATYHVVMNMVENIPVDWNKVGLKSWEEAALSC